MRTVLSDFGNSAQGPLGGGPFGLAIEASGTILVTDRNVGVVLFRVDPATGVRTVLSDFRNPSQGPLGESPFGVALEASGTILVADQYIGLNGGGVLFRVDPVTGSRTLLSNFSRDSGQGPLGAQPTGVAVEPSGTILVADVDGPGVSGRGGLFRVDPGTGVRTVLSDFGDPSQGPRGICPSDVAVEASGTILVGDPCSDTPDGALFRVDPGTGARTLLSNFRDSMQGPLGGDPYGVAVETSGSILVADGSGPMSGVGPGVLFRVDPGTGVRTVLSDFGDSSQGPVGRYPASVSVWAPFGAATPVGTNITVQPIDPTTGTTPVTLTFSQVTQAGITSLTTSTAGPVPPAGFSFGTLSSYYELTTTALVSPPITVCIAYSNVGFGDESQLKLFHFENDHWVDRTISLDTTAKIICATVDSLSPFAILKQITRLTSLSPAKIWIGLKNSDDVGIRFDFRAEVYLNATLAGSGQVTSVPGGSSGFNNAKSNVLSLTLPAPVEVARGSTLSLKMYMRNACSGSGKNSGTARLWYNDAVADSHFGVTIDGRTSDYFLRAESALSTEPGVGPKKTIDVAAGNKCSAFKSFGTWSITR